MKSKNWKCVDDIDDINGVNYVVRYITLFKI